MKVKKRLSKRVSRRRAGFTLVEMLLVLALIGLVAGLALYNLTDIFEGGNEDGARLKIKALKVPLFEYRKQTGDFPQSLDQLLSPLPNGGKAVEDSNALLDPWKQKFQYKFPGERNPRGYDLWTTRNGKTIGNWENSSGT